MIGDAGFRLSVAATAGLLAWGTPLGRWIGGLAGGRMPGWLAEGLGISLAAQAATLPDVLVTFGRLSLVAPVVNLAVVPLVPAAMGAGVLAMAGGALAMLGLPGVVATLLGLPAWLLLHVIVTVVRTLGRSAVRRGRDPARGRPGRRRSWPPCWCWQRHRSCAGSARDEHGDQPRGRVGGDVRVTRPPRRGSPTPTSRGARVLAVAAGIVVALSTIALADTAGRETRLVMLDVGQGDAILVESRAGGRMLVDGGPDPERLLTELDARVPPWDRRIDLVVLTHPHEDHVAGLVRVLERYRVGRVFEPGMHGPGPGWEAWDAVLRRRSSAGHAGGRRPAAAGRGDPDGRVAGVRGARRARVHRSRHQRHVDHPARRGERPPVPAHRRRGGRRRSATGCTRPPADRRPQGGPPRERHGDQRRAPRGDPSRDRPRLRRDRQRLRAPGALDPRAPARRRSPRVPHGPPRDRRRRPAVGRAGGPRLGRPPHRLRFPA